MHRHPPGRGLLARIRAGNTSPFVLSIGGGPRGTAAPTSSSAVLPTFTENFYDMSDLEKDFVMRCYEYLRFQTGLVPSPACAAALRMTASPSLHTSTTSAEAAVAWRPFYDVVMLPDGSVYMGWFRGHALDDCWVPQIQAYVADLWRRAPHALWLERQEQLHNVAYSILHHRQRHMQVFQLAKKVTAKDVQEDCELVIKSAISSWRGTRSLENKILWLWSKKGMTLAALQDLMGELAQHQCALSTGSATALMQMLVSAYALYGASAEGDFVEELRASALRVCALASDSRAAAPLAWAAALLGGSAASALASSPACEVCAGPSEPLLALLQDVIDPSLTHRRAVLCDQVTHCVSPLCHALLQEDALVADTMAQDSPASEKRGSAAARTTPSSSIGFLPASHAAPLLDTADSAHFSSVLEYNTRQALRKGATPPPVVQEQPQQPPSTAFFTWLPGTGADIHGCWTLSLTHSTLLCSQLRLHQRYCKDAKFVKTINAAKEAHHMLLVSLTRRCSFTITESNAWSQYSILTHLKSTRVHPLVNITLLHLSNSACDGGSGAMGSRFDSRQLRGLLYLYPTLEVGSFNGGTVSQFSAALSSGTRSFPCDLEGVVDSAASASSAGAHAATVHVPERFAAPLTTGLERREAAVVCFVHSGISVKSVFLLEELSAHLKHVAVFD